MSTQSGANLYGAGVGTHAENVEIPVISSAAPTSSNINYPLGKRWIDTANNTEYVLTSSTTSSGITTSTWTPTGGKGLYPITPYVVGPSGQAGYQTIQSAINAANAAGGGMIWIQPGTYTENLVFYDNIQIFGDSEQGSYIVGTHTPPVSGTLNLNRLNLVSATDIFSSVSAGTTNIFLEDSTVNVTNGYSFNLPNWTGQIQCFNIGNFGTNDGFVNNTAGAEVFIFSAGAGNGTVNPMILSGITLFGSGLQISCPVHFVTGANFTSLCSSYTQTVTFLNNSTGSFYGDSFITGASPALTMSSSGSVSLSNAVINSSSNPAIAGSGAGTVTLGGITFTNNANIANTLTLAFDPASVFGEVRSAADTGGMAGTISLTKTNSTTISTGTGTVKMSTINNANNAAWIKVYVGTTAYWIPAWATNAP